MYYSVTDIMEILHVCKSTAMRFIKKELPYIYDNQYNKILVKVEDFNSWQSANDKKLSK